MAATVVYEDTSGAIEYQPAISSSCAQSDDGFCADGWTARTGLDDFSDSNVCVARAATPPTMQSHGVRAQRDGIHQRVSRHHVRGAE